MRDSVKEGESTMSRWLVGGLQHRHQHDQSWRRNGSSIKWVVADTYDEEVDEAVAAMMACSKPILVSSWVLLLVSLLSHSSCR